MKRIIVCMLAVVATVGFLSCSKARPPDIGEQIIMERVPGDRPNWVTRVPEDRDGRMFFTGMKTHGSSLENAGTDARQNAIQKIIEYLGASGMVDYTKARVEAGITDEGQAGNYIEDGFRLLAQSVAQGTRETETYYEHVKEWQLDGWHYFYNSYVLLSVAQTDLQRAAAAAFERQAAEARAQNNARAEAFANSLRSQLTPQSSTQGR